PLRNAPTAETTEAPRKRSPPLPLANERAPGSPDNGKTRISRAAARRPARRLVPRGHAAKAADRLHAQREGRFRLAVPRADFAYRRGAPNHRRADRRR